MTPLCEAVYEHDAFRPVAPVEQPLVEAQRVRPVVEADAPEDILGLAASVYDGPAEREVADVVRIALDRSAFSSEPAR